MANNDRFTFPQDFLYRIDASGEIDDVVLAELQKLSADQRAELARLLMARNARIHDAN